MRRRLRCSLAFFALLGCDTTDERTATREPAQEVAPPGRAVVPPDQPFDWVARVGVANLLQDTACLAISNSTLERGARVLLVSPSAPQRSASATIAGRADSCPGEDVRPGDSYYQLQTFDTLEVARIYIAILEPGAHARVVGDTILLDLDIDGHEERFRECTSAEGLHLTIWTGPALTGQRRWHTYVYLGYDLQPTCTDAEI